MRVRTCVSVCFGALWRSRWSYHSSSLDPFPVLTAPLPFAALHPFPSPSSLLSFHSPSPRPSSRPSHTFPVSHSHSLYLAREATRENSTAGQANSSFTSTGSFQSHAGTNPSRPRERQAVSQACMHAGRHEYQSGCTSGCSSQGKRRRVIVGFRRKGVVKLSGSSPASVSCDENS